MAKVDLTNKSLSDVNLVVMCHLVQYIGNLCGVTLIDLYDVNLTNVYLTNIDLTTMSLSNMNMVSVYYKVLSKANLCSKGLVSLSDVKLAEGAYVS